MRVGILTVSDGCAAGTREDRSGPRLEEWAEEGGYEIARRGVVPDDALTITRTLLSWADSGEVDVILTTGGTGFGPRDVTPEATRPLLDREAAGVSARIHQEGVAATPFAPLSRTLVGSRGRVVMANLPGSPGGVRDGMRVLQELLPHMVALLQGQDPAHVPPGPSRDRKLPAAPDGQDSRGEGTP